jgi:hypothetical protein
MTEAKRQAFLLLYVSNDAKNTSQIAQTSQQLRHPPYFASSSISFRPMLYSRLSSSWAHRVKFEIL